ncbi:DUF4087 domain-containing protein [Rhodobacterales bacterium HKCCE3408]|nr:DUF4087 domain-containing protein [Rhodobacterales bacterium HKCCE3408]
MRVALALALLATPAAAAAELRCGWYVNPTPANHWLTDADGTWILGLQGGPFADGFLDLPEGSLPTEWVAVNGYYGYGCACIEGDFAPPDQVLIVRRMDPLPLARCEADPALPSMGG